MVLQLKISFLSDQSKWNQLVSGVTLDARRHWQNENGRRHLSRPRFFSFLHPPGCISLRLSWYLVHRGDGHGEGPLRFARADTSGWWPCGGAGRGSHGDAWLLAGERQKTGAPDVWRLGARVARKLHTFGYMGMAKYAIVIRIGPTSIWYFFS